MPSVICVFTACKRKDQDIPKAENPSPKKPRLVFTDIQRRTLLAIFKETKRPRKEMQTTIAEQLGLKVSTVANFFMNARRRSLDKYMEDSPIENNNNAANVGPPSVGGQGMGSDPAMNSPPQGFKMEGME